ncbi:hypothetical protein B9Z55_022654 [Caenorhabditis nigoni]|uniref:Uncharacterized protein n=1 Tax=Caenorhabditis nigoni TaxID=1611254 RepID=A0A2G5SLC1_9PELO|nr:hypothetical protein B9Z55_022654 [Caenorhabditis nigoni]
MLFYLVLCSATINFSEAYTYLKYLLLGAFLMFSDARSTTIVCLKKLNSYVAGICRDFCANDAPGKAMDLSILAVLCLLLVPAISTSEAEIDLQHLEEVLQQFQPDALPILEELKKDKKTSLRWPAK